MQRPAVVVRFIQHLNIHPAVRGGTGDGGVDRVVDQVAQHGGHVLRFGDLPADEGFGPDAQCDTALIGLHALGANKSLEVWILQELGLVHRELQRPGGGESGQVDAGLLVLSDAHQAGDGMQLVRKLVPLGAEGRGHGTHGVELPRELLQFGAVPEHDHPAQVLASMQGLARTGHQHPPAGHQFNGVRLRGVRPGQRFELLGHRGVSPWRPGQVRLLQQALRRCIEDADPAVGRNADDAVVHALQNGHLVVDQHADFLRFQA